MLYKIVNDIGQYMYKLHIFKQRHIHVAFYIMMAGYIRRRYFNSDCTSMLLRPEDVYFPSILCDIFSIIDSLNAGSPILSQFVVYMPLLSCRINLNEYFDQTLLHSACELTVHWMIFNHWILSPLHIITAKQICVHWNLCAIYLCKLYAQKLQICISWDNH